MGWLIALGVLVVLAVLPMGVSLRYDADGFQLRLLAGLVSFPLAQRQEEKPKFNQDKKTKNKKTKQSSGPKKTAQPKKGGSLSDFIPMIQVALEFLDAFRRKLRIRRLEMKLIMASDDPCDLAVNYGRAWAALGSLVPQLERCFVIKKRNLEVECDFEATSTTISARLDLTMTLGRLVHLALRHGWRAVKEFLNLKKTRKGGAQK